MRTEAGGVANGVSEPGVADTNRMADKFETGRQGESKVKSWLARHGIATRRLPYKSAYDLETTTGIRMEVKTASYTAFSTKKQRHQGQWKFNIHRHGLLDEWNVDYYILLLGPDPYRVLGKALLTVVIPAPLGRKVLLVTPRTLFTHWAQYINNFGLLMPTHQYQDLIAQRQSKALSSLSGCQSGVNVKKVGNGDLAVPEKPDV